MTYVILVLLLGAASVIGWLIWLYRRPLERWAAGYGVRPWRMGVCFLAALACLSGVAILSPVQLPVALYKLALVLVAAYLGYWIDAWAFPYARPGAYLDWRWPLPDFDPLQTQEGVPNVSSPFGDETAPVLPGYLHVFAAAMLRRAIIMVGCMLAVGLGL